METGAFSSRGTGRPTELTRQLEDGRVYDRDLTALDTALSAVPDAYHRRPRVRGRSHEARFHHL